MLQGVTKRMKISRRVVANDGTARKEEKVTCISFIFIDSGRTEKKRSFRARIYKRLWGPGIDSDESISPAYVALRAGTTNRAVVAAYHAGNRFLGSLKGLQIPAQLFVKIAGNTYKLKLSFQKGTRYYLNFRRIQCFVELSHLFFKSFVR